jgi:hypothetical protein
VLTAEAEAYLTSGSAEAQLFAAVPPEGVAMATLKAALPAEVSDVGFKQAMQQKWVALDKSGGEPRVVRKVRSGDAVCWLSKSNQCREWVWGTEAGRQGRSWPDC